MTRSARPLLFDRQKQLLGLLRAFGGKVGNLDFQKLLLLYCAQEGESPAYEFVPYKFGAFSFISYADRRKLMERGLLEESEHFWELTREGRVQARRLRIATATIARFALAHRDLRGDPLVAETYRRFPYYAINSEIAERVLRGDDHSLRQIDAARPARAERGIATIGYEGRTLESYLNVLLVAGVTLLCDVRRNPISRKYGFSKGTLSNGCTNVGIRYEHLPELGIASEKRQSLDCQEDYEALFAEYERDSLPNQLPALSRIHRWVMAGETVALTCYEKAPEQCHRHCVTGSLVEQFGSALAPRHL